MAIEDSPRRQKRKKNPTGTPLNNYGVGTVYVSKEDEHLWLKALERADRLNLSRSQYIIALIEEDLKGAARHGA